LFSASNPNNGFTCAPEAYASLATGWRICGCLFSVISFAGHEHLLGGSLFLLRFLQSELSLELLHGSIILIGIIAFAIAIFRVTTFV
jgi:hypothetical protein